MSTVRLLVIISLAACASAKDKSLDATVVADAATGIADAAPGMVDAPLSIVDAAIPDAVLPDAQPGICSDLCEKYKNYCGVPWTNCEATCQAELSLCTPAAQMDTALCAIYPATCTELVGCIDSFGCINTQLWP